MNEGEKNQNSIIIGEHNENYAIIQDDGTDGGPPPTVSWPEQFIVSSANLSLTISTLQLKHVLVARKLTASSPIYCYLNECLTYFVGTFCMHSLTCAPSFDTLDCKFALN